jgi:predicted component of type VI protein secretion system
MRLALRFISGKYQGGEYPLEQDGEVIVGRSSDLDMVLVEEMVSRRHARFQLQTGELKVEDLGSTNGTFVNGERVTQAVLKEGDRVLIGSNILKVVMTDGSPTQAAMSQGKPVRRTGDDARMRGNLAEIPLPDLLQLFGSSRKTATLVISNETHRGRIHLREGIVRAVEIENLEGEPKVREGLKFAYRMIAWESGLFELMPEEQREFSVPLEASVQEILMEGFRQKDEFEQLTPRLPKPQSTLTPTQPLTARLSDLGKEELDVFQAVLNCSGYPPVLDASPHPDLKTAQVLLALLEKRYLHLEAPSSGTVRGTTQDGSGDRTVLGDKPLQRAAP